MAEIAALNERFAIKGEVSFKSGPGGLIVAEVNNKAGAATIALQGAQVMTWAPAGEKPVVWLSQGAKFAPGKSIRGGVPICWPWFGAHASEPSFPGHGYARTVMWELLKTKSLTGDRTLLMFRLLEGEASRMQWRHATPVECHITVGRALEVELITHNSEKGAVVITEALHTYLEVGDVRKVSVRGLEGGEYLDKVEGFKRKTQSGAVTIAGEVDRVYVNTDKECIIDDPVYARRIHIKKRGSQSTVVWNPWVEKAAQMGDLGDNGYLNMLCVESGNAADNTVTIAPGTEHHLWVSYHVEH